MFNLFGIFFKIPCVPLATACGCGRMRRGIKRRGGSGGGGAGRFLVMRQTKGAAVTNLPPGHFFEGGLFMSFSSASFCSSLLSLLP